MDCRKTLAWYPIVYDSIGAEPFSFFAFEAVVEKFEDPIFGFDKDARKDAAKFVEVLSKESLKIKTKIYKLAPLNFFYQQDPNKQTTFHNIAALEKKCDNLLNKLFQGLTDKENDKLVMDQVKTKAEQTLTNLTKLKIQPLRTDDHPGE